MTVIWHVTQYIYVLFDNMHFISINLSLHWRHVQKMLKNVQRNYVKLRQITPDNRNTHHNLWLKIRVLHIVRKIHLFLMQSLCHIFFLRYGISLLFNNLRRRSDVTIFLRYVGVNRNTKLQHKYSLTFDGLRSECSGRSHTYPIHCFVSILVSM
jgi:hypothetical protein